MSNTTGGRPNQTSDRIIALRLWLHRKLDDLYDRICDPAFNGTVGIEISGKGGRPGEPRTKEEQYGVSEI